MIMITMVKIIPKIKILRNIKKYLKNVESIWMMILNNNNYNNHK